MNINQILIDLRAEQARIERAIAAIEALSGSTANTGPSTQSNSVRLPKRRLSAAGRRRIAEAARKRWAAVKASAKPQIQETSTPAKKSGRKPMSAAARKRISEQAKKRWAAKNAKAVKA